MNSLSERQQKMLDFIIKFYIATEYPPTIREIGEEVGISSTSVVNYNLTRLEEANLLTRHQKVSRGLALNWAKLFELKLVNEADLPPMITGQFDERSKLNGHAPDEPSEFTLPHPNGVRIPVVSVIAAGQPIEGNPDVSSPIGWVDVSESMLAPGKLGKLDGLYALKVKGDSMIDASIRDGDYVILRHQQQAENGQMVAAWIDGADEATLKYLYLKGRKVQLVPDNPAYKTMEYDADKVRVMGRVVSVIRYY